MTFFQDLDACNFYNSFSLQTNIIIDKNAVLHTNPHYTDDRFKHPQTIFGQEEEGLNYDYSDRLWQWDWDKAEKATKTANKKKIKPKTCKWFEAYLSAYYNKKIVIKHILAGVNCSNGFSYLVFGYKVKE